MSEQKTAAVGDHASVVLFHAAGVTTRSVSSVAEAEKAVIALAKEGYGVIFLTERYATQMPELTERYRRAAYPIILPVPDRTGATGESIRHVVDNMEKAIGTNLFEKNERKAGEGQNLA